MTKAPQGEMRAANGQAIGALEQNRAVAFLQSTGAGVLRRLSLSAAGPPEGRGFGAEDMTTQNRDLLSSFLSSMESLSRCVNC